jgi:lysophospholipase L1-like esterase
VRTLARLAAAAACAILLLGTGLGAVWRVHQAAAGLDGAAIAQAVPVRIMPLGDSITYGGPNAAYGGYRHLMGALLERDGYTAQFVGSQRSGDRAIPDPANEGHPGWTIQQLQNGIDTNGWLETYQPDIVLLHIGTNDMNPRLAAAAPAHLAALLGDVLVRLPQAQVIVAQIIPTRSGTNAAYDAYNAAIPAIVAAAGPRVSMVDMRAVLSPRDYADGLHPNDRGYDKMARAWEPALRAALRSRPTTSAGTVARRSSSEKR